MIYLLFGYDFEAQGGINDLIDHFVADGDTEAIEKAKELCKYTNFDSYQLVRVETTQVKQLPFGLSDLMGKPL